MNGLGRVLIAVILAAVLGAGAYLAVADGNAPSAATRDNPSAATKPTTQPPALAARPANAPKASGVCPPFKLRDEQGKEIDPAKGINTTEPYSPRQTCGACHDYEKITQGFHFTQGKGESPPQQYADRYQWVTAPGNYGGNWCSPAPLYRQLARKENSDARQIDMTSYEFVTATCGNCHPGGGPLELDRKGNRYDRFMKEQGLVSGGDNGFDGDYFKARWDKTGVIEADCLLCHMPAYDFKKRNAQLANLNFRWAATEAAGLAKVTGKVSAGETPHVTYDPARFDAEGHVLLHMAPEPRNETCLTCHAKPGWKKRGASFSPRTDVHIAAGLRCVDCHAAGSRAAHEMIRGKEEHQFGKGDDPSGFVRNDLDNTVRSCADCHETGWHNAPRSSHAWLPPLHMDKLSCQACHIPTRSVKSALVQASDVYNPAPRISPPGKHIWTFYDQQMNFWNHYGELELFTVHDQPTNITRPTLARYKGKIFPVNRVHSAWVGFEEDGKPGLNQLFMKDFYAMWKQHWDAPTVNWPQLATITDDNGDGTPEVNRPEEIDALLSAVKAYLEKTSFPLAGRRLVWVSDSRAWYSSKESKQLPRQGHEATAYASVYKFSHDITPARSALGSNGCTDCHRFDSPFFDRPVLQVAFATEDARPQWLANGTLLDIAPATLWLGAFREQYLKPAMHLLLGLSLAIIAVLAMRGLVVRHESLSAPAALWLGWAVLGLIALGGIIALATPRLLEYMVITRFSLDALHFWVAVLVIALGTILALQRARPRMTQTTPRPISILLWVFVAWSALCGMLMVLNLSPLAPVTRLAYTGLDGGLAMISILMVVVLLMRLATVPATQPQDTAQ
mgnify:CR=1 FL=1